MDPPSGVLQTFLYGSFYDRVANPWPAYFNDILTNVGSDVFGVLLGGGLGSTGAPQKVFLGGPVLADSSIMYLWGSFGIFGVAFWFYLLFSLKRGLHADSSTERGIAISGAFLMLLSITTDIWESTFALLYVGMFAARFGTINGFRVPRA